MTDHQREAERKLADAEAGANPTTTSVTGYASISIAHGVLAILDEIRGPVPTVRVGPDGDDPTRRVVEEIYLERCNAIEQGWDDAHDDAHGRNHLLDGVTARISAFASRHDLVVAAQFLVAEIERLDREKARR